MTRSSFQSTPSSRRETIKSGACAARRKNFNPLPPRGGRPHLPALSCNWQLFQSTPSSRRETLHLQCRKYEKGNFNPLPPRGGRPSHKCHYPSKHEFQSTPSSRRETSSPAAHSDLEHFNPLPPRGGRRSTQAPGRASSRDFNPLPPRGGRPSWFDLWGWTGSISIHSLLAEGDRMGVMMSVSE